MRLTNVYELIREYKKHNPDGHFFDRETLKFFGERLSEMRVLKKTVNVTDWDGEHTCHVVSVIQRNNFFGTVSRKYHYFDVNTFEDIHPEPIAA